MAPSPGVTSIFFDKVLSTTPLHLNTLLHSAHYTLRSPSVKQILGSSKLGVTTVKGWVRALGVSVLDSTVLDSTESG